MADPKQIAIIISSPSATDPGIAWSQLNKDVQEALYNHSTPSLGDWETVLVIKDKPQVTATTNELMTPHQCQLVKMECNMVVSANSQLAMLVVREKISAYLQDHPPPPNDVEIRFIERYYNYINGSTSSAPSEDESSLETADPPRPKRASSLETADPPRPKRASSLDTADPPRPKRASPLASSTLQTHPVQAGSPVGFRLS